MATVSLNADFGKTYTNGMGNDFNTYTPNLDVGLGFGALPKSLNLLRPFALTAEISEDLPRPGLERRKPEPVQFQLGLRDPVQPALFQRQRRANRQCVPQAPRPLTEFSVLAPGRQFRRSGTNGHYGRRSSPASCTSPTPGSSRSKRSCRSTRERPRRRRRRRTALLPRRPLPRHPRQAPLRSIKQ